MTTMRVTHYRTASPETWGLIRGAWLRGLSAPTVADIPTDERAVI